jgi:hypothetical protein
MSDVSHHRHDLSRHQGPADLEGVPAEEEVSTADAVERVDEDPDEQENRRDPVWDDDEDHEA